MSVAFTGVKGLVLWNSYRAYNGVTLIAPLQGNGAWLIDMRGRHVNYWEMGYRPGCYGELLPTGNLLYAGKDDSGPLADLEGAGGILLEADWEGKVTWEYRDPFMHHAFYRMKNGNTLVLKWVKVPEKIAIKVKGGEPGTEREGVMWGDTIQEITPDGKVAWEWIAHDRLDPEVDTICPICPRSMWPHINSIVELPDGNILVSLMKTNTVAVIDRMSGSVKLRWGAGEDTGVGRTGELGHQHSATALDNGNILVFDNGLHPHGPIYSYSRVLEVDPNSGKMVWAYTGGADGPMFFYSAIMSNCQRLPNGNTFICEGTTGRLFEVTPGGELVWEYVNSLPSSEPSPKTKPCIVYSAYRYGLDYPGLKGMTRMPEQRQLAPGKSLTMEEKIKSRLDALGY